MAVQPKIAINCRTVAPFSAASAAPALRNPCAEQCFSPATSQCLRNQLPKPFEMKGLPNAVTRKARLPVGVAQSTAFNSGRTGPPQVDAHVPVPVGVLDDVFQAHAA